MNKFKESSAEIENFTPDGKVRFKCRCIINYKDEKDGTVSGQIMHICAKHSEELTNILIDTEEQEKI